MNHRYWKLKKPLIQPGFTIVEIIIALIVIGVLASLALVGYSGIQQNNAVTVLKADLQQAQVQLEEDKWDKGQYPESKELADGGNGLKSSPGITLDYNKFGGSYCIQASSAKAGTSFRINGRDGVAEEGECTPPTP